MLALSDCARSLLSWTGCTTVALPLCSHPLRDPDNPSSPFRVMDTAANFVPLPTEPGLDKINIDVKRERLHPAGTVQRGYLPELGNFLSHEVNRAHGRSVPTPRSWYWLPIFFTIACDDTHSLEVESCDK